MGIEETVRSIKGRFKEDTIVDFVQLTKLFGEPRYQLLIKKALDLESRILISAAKNRELYQDVMNWADKKGKVKKSTLSDRKHYLVELGLISEEAEKKDGGRGRPRKRLCMTEGNRQRFEELFGEPL
ncbi:MAG: DUF5821 family protein [Candidatus Hydrothermarchaeales archaeon]